MLSGVQILKGYMGDSDTKDSWINSFGTLGCNHHAVFMAFLSGLLSTD